ncbi:hypothetical protein TREES_T100015872 [Tupaia chinensis]|uniref:Uncharacterized protein n=1 Tax=Tupaia chinensis TaxID=246437 RepID=L9L195_TUPCH|nr:hypothetical protein TREES_T100015872 [Tupaia chinensis]
MSFLGWMQERKLMKGMKQDYIITLATGRRRSQQGTSTEAGCSKRAWCRTLPLTLWGCPSLACVQWCGLEHSQLGLQHLRSSQEGTHEKAVKDAVPPPFL